MTKSNEYYIEKAKIVHNNYYTYPNFKYVNREIKVKIECPIHGEFEQLTHSHLNGQGCKKCGIIKRANTQRTTNEEFLKKANIKHNNKYEYPDLNYINNKTEINIICPIHGSFPQTPMKHLAGKGCKKCGRISCGNKQRSCTEEFIEKAKIVHNNLYKYSNTIYVDSNSEVIITCPIHRDFPQDPSNHLAGKGCPICKQSGGEKEIMNYLKNKNIFTLQEHRFLDCKYKYTLRFDFYLPEYNICIEFDGEQHFISKDFFGGDEKLKYLQNNDRIKNEYCKNNNINLIRIRYDENIIDKLNEIDFIIK